MAPQEALKLAEQQNPNTQFTGTAIELPDKYVFELAPKGSNGKIMDTLYSVDKKTGTVEAYSPVEDPNYSFATAKPLDL